jgi:hypothetical protein
LGSHDYLSHRGTTPRTAIRTGHGTLVLFNHFSVSLWRLLTIRKIPRPLKDFRKHLNRQFAQLK